MFDIDCLFFHHASIYKCHMQHYLTWMGGFIKKMLLAKYLCDSFGEYVASK